MYVQRGMSYCHVCVFVSVTSRCYTKIDDDEIALEWLKLKTSIFVIRLANSPIEVLVLEQQNVLQVGVLKVV